MGLRDIIRAIREYPTACAELETAGFELRLASEQEVSAIEHKATELKLYSPLSRKLENSEGGQPPSAPAKTGR